MNERLHCGYHQANLCQSCTLLGVPYSQQLATKDDATRELLAPYCGQDAASPWLEPVASAPSRFRNKAKMVVGGSVDHPTLGILNRARRGVDLRSCALIDPVIQSAFEPITTLITQARLDPYDVPARRGEAKSVLITASPNGQLLVRFVLRSTARLAAIRAHLPKLLAQVPNIAIVSVNILPEHKAVLEGDREIHLHGPQCLTMELAGLTLNLPARSFFQTNTAVAAALYEQARRWCHQAQPETVWDLYCGVGGFALACAAPGRAVTGVEVSPQAIEAARQSARTASGSTAFIAADASQWARQQPQPPQLVILNPPRRGIGVDLATWLESSGVPDVIYSSCRPASLATDLAAMPSLAIHRGRVFDMFAQSEHLETMVWLRRC